MPHRVVTAFSCIFLAISGFGQARRPQKIDPQAQLFSYYRQYPDRYIRISQESWRYNQRTRVAQHSFTLNNTAMVPYCEIRIRFEYKDEKGATLLTQSQQLAGILQPYRPVQQKDVTLKAVPAPAVNVVVSVDKALVCR